MDKTLQDDIEKAGLAKVQKTSSSCDENAINVIVSRKKCRYIDLDRILFPYFPRQPFLLPKEPKI
jgi:hypothetical protein